MPLSHAPVWRPDEPDPILSPPPPVVVDPITGSSIVRDSWIDERVRGWMGFWTSEGASDFQIYLERLEHYRPLVEAEIARRDLPASLLFLPIVESGYATSAVSGARAVGLWQFMDYTARERGLTVSPLLDERRDPVRATPEALDFLAELRVEFGSWYLALAAYNGGPARMRSALRRLAPLAAPDDSLFVSVRSNLPPETREFIPKLLAAATLGARPTSYGFDPPQSEPLRYDEVEVTDAVSTDIIARAAGVDLSSIEMLNPQLLRGFTPPDVRSVIRIPEGSGESFAVNLARIPPQERVSFIEHKVERGETFTHIARRYGVRVSTLVAANPSISPRRLQIGQWVVVPRGPRAVDRPPVVSFRRPPQ
jgi:peptidoglycan lytic transglycosylase D